MDKAKKKALKYGVNENCERLDYCCPKCGFIIPLAAKRCPNCRKRRPADAYERSLSYQAEMEASRMPKVKNVPVPGVVCKTPAPKSMCYASPYANAGCYPVAAPTCYASPEAERLGIPKFYSTDEYGRVFEMPVSYKTLGIGGPVPVPIPSQTIQTSPIDIPVNFNV